MDVSCCIAELGSAQYETFGVDGVDGGGGGHKVWGRCWASW